MATEWKWSAAHGDYYMYRLRPGTQEYDLIWARSQVSPPTPQPSAAPAPAPAPTPQYAVQPGYDYSQVTRDPRYPYTQYATATPQSTTGYTAPEAGPYQGYGKHRYGGQSSSSGSASTDTNASTAVTSTELQDFMSPVTSPHRRGDPNDLPSDDECLAQYEEEQRAGDTASNSREDPRYEEVKDPKKFFKKGRIFMVLWADASNTQQSFFPKVRRYVVIRSRSNHCLCLAIHTYGGAATSKYGVYPDEHAPLVCNQAEVETHPNERPLRKEALSVVLEPPTKWLSPYSRIDFGKVYPINYNFKVRRIGRIDSPYLNVLEAYFRAGIGVYEAAED